MSRTNSQRGSHQPTMFGTPYSLTTVPTPSSRGPGGRKVVQTQKTTASKPTLARNKANSRVQTSGNATVRHQYSTQSQS